jgi:putative transposase
VLVAGEHARVSDARRDFLHQTSTDLVRRFQRVAVEDLAAANLVKIRKPAKAISRSGWGQFRALLTYQAQRCGATLVVVGCRYPSSRTCSACGHLLPSSSLATRRWTCPGCGTRHDRDVNAAKKIAAAAGPAADACGGDVSHQGFALAPLPVKQELAGASPQGIPVPQVRE